jgi:hypothetical protein
MGRDVTELTLNSLGEKVFGENFTDEIDTPIYNSVVEDLGWDPRKGEVGPKELEHRQNKRRARNRKGQFAKEIEA